ncbi:MAG: helix-turn-helix domain-containing protein [Phycisphaerae bacterium]|nr:helix-turn-helix domain-containing protein [Phycisphaerae bacterium]
MEQRFRQIIVKESTPADHEWLTVEDVAQELKVSQSIVYRWIETGNLRAVDLRESNGRRGQRGFYRIRRSMLDEFLASRETQSSPGTEQKVRPVKRLPKMKNYLKL